jgi:O-antigen ligase
MNISITKYNIHEWFMAAGVFCMSVYSKGVTVFFAMAFLTMLGQIFFGGRKMEWKSLNGWAYLFFGIFSAFLLSGIWNDWNHKTALSEIETKISFVAFPLLFLFTSKNILQSQRKFQWALVFGGVFFALLCHVHAVFGFFETGLWEEFVYGRLSWTFHPTYLGFFYLLSLVFLASEFLESTDSRVSKYLLAGIVFFSLETAFMASRAGFLALFLFYAVFAFYVFRNGKNRKRAMVVISSSMISFLMLFFGFSPISGRAKEAVENSKSISESKKEEKVASTSERIVSWETAWDIARDYPMGVGTGNWKSHFTERYTARGAKFAAEHSHPAHNAYLQILVEWGWAGLMTLLALLLLGLRRSWQTNDLFFLVFVLGVCFHFIFESMLELQQGLVFIGFWMFFLVHRKRDSKVFEV